MNSFQALEQRKQAASELISRAKAVGYKNQIPKLPDPHKLAKNFDHLLIGYDYRLNNWMNGLLSLEFPSGRLNKEGEKNVQKISSPSAIEELLLKYQNTNAS
jgi:hypothetical protein